MKTYIFILLTILLASPAWAEDVRGDADPSAAGEGKSVREIQAAQGGQQGHIQQRNITAGTPTVEPAALLSGSNHTEVVNQDGSLTEIYWNHQNQVTNIVTKDVNGSKLSEYVYYSDGSYHIKQFRNSPDGTPSSAPRIVYYDSEGDLQRK